MENISMNSRDEECCADVCQFVYFKLCFAPEQFNVDIVLVVVAKKTLLIIFQSFFVCLLEYICHFCVFIVKQPNQISCLYSLVFDIVHSGRKGYHEWYFNCEILRCEMNFISCINYYNGPATTTAP